MNSSRSSPLSALETESLHPTLRVVIMDNRPLVVLAMESALADAGLVVAAVCSSPAPIKAVWSTHRPDVLVSAAHLEGDRDGIDAVRDLRAAHPEARALIYCNRTDRATLLSALAAGASGYVRATATVAEFVHAVTEVGLGRGGYDPMTATDMIAALQPDGTVATLLTPREEQVLTAMASGLTSTKQLARHLHMGPATVKSHMTALGIKLEAHDRAAIVAAAYCAGLLPDRRRN